MRQELAPSIRRSGNSKRRDRVKAIMLDDHLFSLNLESWTVSIATPGGRAKFRLLHGQYHEKFKVLRPGQIVA